MMIRLIFTIVLLSFASASELVTRANNTYTGCNNSPDLCERSYSSITHLAAHDSPFWSPVTNNDDSANQHFSSPEQLSAGVRMLTAQIHQNNGSLDLCHTSCFLKNAGSLTEWLQEINEWMGKNPNEVVTLLLVNFDDAPASDIDREFTNSGIKRYVYEPESLEGPRTDWPTLQELIGNNTRLLTFVADVVDQAEVAPYLMSEFQFMFENNFEVTDITNFTCTPERPDAVRGDSSRAVTSGYLPIMNHFLDIQEAFGIQIPDKANISTTNSPSTSLMGALGTTARQCQEEWDRIPSFILVDYFEQGPALETIDDLNGVKEPVGRSKLVQPSTIETSGTQKATDTSIGNAGMALIALFVYMVAFM